MTTTLRRRNNSERDIEFKSDQIKSSYTNQIYSNRVLDVCDMACRDRTAEFLAVVKNNQERLRDGYFPSKKARQVKGMEGFNNFMVIAKQIGRDINSTFTKLEKLTLLAKKRSLYADKPVEIHELTYIIKEDISSLNKQIAHLQQVSKARNNHGKDMVTHSNTVVVSLQSKLASMSNDFRHVLEVRTKNLKHEKDRRQKFSEGTVSATLPASAVSGHNGSVLLADEHTTNSRGDFAIDMGSDHFQRQIQLIDEQDSYIQDRSDAMENIEATIVELGTIFQELAHMVKEQEEVIQRIDSNVDDTHLNIEAAHSEILKYFQSVTSNRWLMIKVFAVLIVFFIIFVVFVA